MTDTRKAKIDGIAKFIPEQEVALGEASGKLAVVGWGSTYGPIQQAVRRARARGQMSATSTSAISGRCRAISALCCKNYERILVPEMNTGPAQDRAARPVPGRRQAVQQGLRSTFQDCRNRSRHRPSAGVRS